MSTPLLRVTGLSMTFPGLKALDDVSLTVVAGEIVGLVGQNGSGKSTLVKVLAGLHRPDLGSRIELADGAERPSGVHLLHQDLGLIGSLSTVENLDMARPLGCGQALRPAQKSAERRAAQRLVAEFGGTFDEDLPVSELSAEVRTLVAIARALSGWAHTANVLVLDEPTAPLHDEVDLLFDAVRRVAARGAGVLFVSHRLDEAMDLVDRVAVLRDGALVADVPRSGLAHDALVRLIAGAPIWIPDLFNGLALLVAVGLAEFQGRLGRTSANSRIRRAPGTAS